MDGLIVILRFDDSLCSGLKPRKAECHLSYSFYGLYLDNFIFSKVFGREDESLEMVSVIGNNCGSDFDRVGKLNGIRVAADYNN